MRALTVLLVLVALVAALGLRAPATLIDRRVAQLTGDAMRIADARGTAWHGRGTLWGAGGRWQVPVAWQADVPALLRGELAVRLLPEGDALARGRVVLREDNVHLDDFHATVPARAAMDFVPRAPSAYVGGDVTLDAPSLDVGTGRIDGGFEARWPGARIALGTLLLDLGQVTASGHGQGRVLDVTLRGEGGDVGLDGRARVEAGRASVDATLRPSPATPATVAAIVRSLGPATPDGGVRVVMRSGG